MKNIATSLITAVMASVTVRASRILVINTPYVNSFEIELVITDLAFCRSDVVQCEPTELTWSGGVGTSFTSVSSIMLTLYGLIYGCL